MLHIKKTSKPALRLALLGAACLLVACGTRAPAVEAAEPPPAAATAQNSIVMPAVTYGTTAEGVRLSKADDTCGVPALLRQSIEDQLEAPWAHLLAEAGPGAAAAPVLQIEVIDLLANAGGLYGGPKIVKIRGTLVARPGAAASHFTAQRQMFIYFGLPRSTCSMVGKVTDTLGADILGWLKKPVDGAFLGER